MSVRLPAAPGRHTAESRGYTISYEDAGAGSPVVLVPGYMQSATDYRQAGYVDRLAATHRVLIPDPLGHGQSDKPHEPVVYRKPGVAADVIAVLDAAGLHTAALWGYSRGAELACMAAIEFPQRLTALILGGAGDLTQPPLTEIPWVDPLSRGDWAGFWSLFPGQLTADVKRHFEESNDPKALAAATMGHIESAYKFDLGRVSHPALVYCGSDDKPDDALPTAQALRTELRVVEGDHFGVFKAVDSVVPLVVAFLKEVASADDAIPDSKRRSPRVAN